MTDFKCTIEDIKLMEKTLGEIQNILTQTCSYAMSIYEDLSVENQEIWKGDAYLVGCAFLHLTVQYHELLAGSGEGAVQQAVNDIQKYIVEDENFYSDWEVHTELLSIV